MIPAQFDYLAPTSVEDALAALSQHGDDAKIIAGGQSLLPVLRMRLNAPEMIIDLGRIESLRGVRDDGDAIVIGAMTPHAVVGSDPLVAEHASVINKAVEHLADAQIRHRGTFGGALAHADPAGDLGAPALALGAEFVIQGPGGTRRVGADDFFVDLFETAIGEDEILTEVRVPKHTGWGAHYEKFVRVAHQWPIVAVAATVRVDAGTIAEARIGLTNMGSTPLRARGVEEALVGQPATEDAVRAAASAPPREPTRPRTSTATPTTGGTWRPSSRDGPCSRPRGREPVDLTHKFTVPTGVEEAWAHFNDIASVAECFPGAAVSSVEGESFHGSVKVKLGPIALVYNGSGTFVEKDEGAHRFVVEAKGKDKRGNGTAGATVTLTMTPSGGETGAASTDVEVVTDLAITGKPAQFGRGVMQDVSDKLLGQFIDCLEQRMGEPAEPAAPEPVVADAPDVSVVETRGGADTSGARDTSTRTEARGVGAGRRPPGPRRDGAAGARPHLLAPGARSAGGADRAAPAARPTIALARPGPGPGGRARRRSPAPDR